MRTAVTGEVQLHTVLLEVGAGDAPGSGARAQMRGAAVPIDPVRSKTFTSSMWSGPAPASLAATHTARSEEHTSELQSRGHLVCRLLLEKKKEALDDDVEAKR